MFCKKGVLRNFAKFTGKHLCQENTFLRRTPLVAASVSVDEIPKLPLYHFKLLMSPVSFVVLCCKVHLLLKTRHNLEHRRRTVITILFRMFMPGTHFHDI